MVGAGLSGAVIGRHLAEAGHQVKVADLYAEGFQPAMIEADFAQFAGEPLPIAIQAEQARVEWSDAMIFIFPLWWWSMPAPVPRSSSWSSP